MRTLDVKKITETIRRMTVEVNTDLPQDVEQALVEGRAKEESPFGQYCLDQILANAKLARCEKQAMCQDTGTRVEYWSRFTSCRWGFDRSSQRRHTFRI